VRPLVDVARDRLCRLLALNYGYASRRQDARDFFTRHSAPGAGRQDQVREIVDVWQLLAVEQVYRDRTVKAPFPDVFAGLINLLRERAG
jgi:hypothetical protein